MTKTVLTRTEVSPALGVSLATVDKLIQEGAIPSFRPSPRRVVIPSEAFVKWLEKQTNP
jgi:excisionase family DNA binding protein